MESAGRITEELVNCATLVTALPRSLEAVFKSFTKGSNRPIHGALRGDFLFSFDGMRRYPFFEEVQSKSQRLGVSR